MGQYLPIVALTVLAVLFGALSFVASRLLAPRRPNTAKEAPYECGIVPSQEPPERFPVSFFIVAMLFIMFDIEIIFAFPYALEHRAMGVFGLMEMVSFSLVFFIAFAYAIARGALDWGPLQKYRRVDNDPVYSATRTTSTTIRRVGTEGRVDSDGEAA